MKNLLVVNSSPNLQRSVSRLLTKYFIKIIRLRNPSVNVVVRDIAANVIPHLDQSALSGLSTEENITEGIETRQLSDELISELNTADTVVFGLPMHNFTIPSTLKAYFDHVARVGVTLGFGENGLIGLLKDKKSVVITAGGGMNLNTERDFVKPYVKHFLSFVGIDKVSFIDVPGTLYGDKIKEEAIECAKVEIDNYLAENLPLHSSLKDGLQDDGTLNLSANDSYLHFSAQLFNHVKRASYEICGLTVDGELTKCDILDIGCGIGVDTLAMSELVSEDSTILGIDSNSKLVETAKARSALSHRNNVIHEIADCTYLDYEQKFDISRCERLFQHLHDPYSVFRSMVNSVKFNGHVVVVETDWSSLRVKNLSNVENIKISSFFSNKLPNGNVANVIHNYFEDARLSDITHHRIETILDKNAYDLITQKDRFLPECFKDKSERDSLEAKMNAASNATKFATIDSVVISGIKSKLSNTNPEGASNFSSAMIRTMFFKPNDICRITHANRESLNGDALLKLVNLINDAYTTAEEGLFDGQVNRTSVDKLQSALDDNCLFVATYNNDVIGSVVIKKCGINSVEFGMLVVDPRFRNQGLGRALVQFAEEVSLRQGYTKMQLRLLTPVSWKHDHKEFLKNWYQNLGYSFKENVDFEPDNETDTLITECICQVLTKPLSPHALSPDVPQASMSV